MQNTQKIVGGIIVAIIALLIGYIIGNSQTGNKDQITKQVENSMESTEEPVVVGFISPLTGDAAYIGDELVNTVNLALRDVNNNGGVNGRPIEVIFEDGKCTGKDAVNAAQKLINVDKVQLILGAGCSGETLAVAPLANKNEVLLFSAVSTSPDITNAGDFVFRNAPSDLDSGAATAEMAVRNNHLRIAAIHESTDYAIGFLNSFVERYEELGGEIVSTESFVTGTNDFRTLVSKVVNQDIDAVLVSPQGKSGGLLVRQVREGGYTDTIYANITVNGSEPFELSQGELEGVLYSDAAPLDETKQSAKAFLDMYKQEYGEGPAFTYYSAAQWDAVHLLTKAMNEVGINGPALRDYLYDLEGYSGLLGITKFDQNGDVQGIAFTDFIINSNGEGVPLGQ